MRNLDYESGKRGGSNIRMTNSYLLLLDWFVLDVFLIYMHTINFLG